VLGGGGGGGGKVRSLAEGKLPMSPLLLLPLGPGNFCGEVIHQTWEGLDLQCKLQRLGGDTDCEETTKRTRCNQVEKESLATYERTQTPSLQVH